ncbi:MAG: hypothetical protein H5T86_15575, partial [Armatimonadetes bacterium]|nr:hypothetical protein [Armatimonadota bacterium]
AVVRELLGASGQWQSAGEHSVVWDGRDDSGAVVAAGVYPYRITATNSSGTVVYDPGAGLPQPVNDLTKVPYGDGVYFVYTIRPSAGAKVRLRIGSMMLLRTLIDWDYRAAGLHTTDYWDYRDDNGYRLPQGEYMAAIWTIPAPVNGIVVQR